jgi:hypothetical protein
MSDEISRYTSIRAESLDPCHYTQSLMNEAMQAGILSGEEVEQIQLELLNLLAEQIKRYTNGQSSSVAESTAQSLLQSVFYFVDTKLLSMPIADAADCLRLGDMHTLFSEGSELVKAYVEEARSLLNKISAERLNVELLAYNGTIDSLPEFFTEYDVRFAPHEAMGGCIDYQLSEDDMHIGGVRYILNYLKTLSLEDEICRHFPIRNINLLLERHGAVYGYDYREMLVNMFELLLTNAICAVLLGKSAQTILLSRTDCTNLAGKIGSAAVLSAAGLVCSELELPKTQCEYVKRCAKRLVPAFLLAAQQGTLEQLTAAC